MDSLLRGGKWTFTSTQKHKRKKSRNFVREHSEAYSWTNLYPRSRTFIKAKPLNGDLQNPGEGFQEKVYFQIQNSRLLYSIITNSIHSKRLNWKKQICVWSCPLSVEVMEFSCTPHRTEEFKDACLSQMTRGTIMYYGHITLSSHPKRHTVGSLCQNTLAQQRNGVCAVEA